MPTEADYNALITDAGSPNAAKCFAGWQATPEGAEVFESVEFKENLDISSGAPADATILLIETAEEAALTSRLFQEVASVFVAS